MQTGQAEGAGQQGRKAKNLCRASNQNKYADRQCRQRGRQAELKQIEHEIYMQTGQAEGAGQQGRKAKNLCRECKMQQKRDMRTYSADRRKTDLADTQEK